MTELGPMEGATIAEIIDRLKTQRYDEVEMTFAIYYWITHQVSFSEKDFHHKGHAKLNASAALNQRSTTSEGYAQLFKAMCDYARVECVVQTGVARPDPEYIGSNSSRLQHSWNAVRIKNTWYCVDACWGAGRVNKKFREFHPQYTDAWFFTNRKLFYLSHFPTDRKSAVKDNAISKLAYNMAPVVRESAIVYQVLPGEGLRGRVRSKEGDCKRLVFEMKQPDRISKIHSVIDGQIIATDFYIQGDTLSVDLPTPDAGKYPIYLYINNAPAFGFLAEVSKKKKH